MLVWIGLKKEDATDHDVDAKQQPRTQSDKENEQIVHCAALRIHQLRQAATT